ncbi:MAG: two-component system sensor histidine kinase NtrB [Myxococcota bacterium]
MPRDLQKIIDAVLDGVVVVDEDGHVEFVNAEACRILGTSAENALADRIDDLVGPDNAVAKAAHAVLGSGRSTIESETRLPRRFQEDVVVDVAASPLLEGRACTGVVIALRDRTIHHTLAEWVSERERLSSFGQIASGIAHEVKNPLGGIRGAAELLSKRASEDRTREAADLIVREVDRIVALVDDMLVFTQGRNVRIASVNIHRVLDDVLDLLSMDPLARGVSIERSFDPSIPDLQADGDRLVQVFLNLGRNALQALDGRGTLRIATRMALDHRLTGEHGEAMPTVSVIVEDDGPGIPPDLLDRVTTPLFTTREGGTGLGLAVSRHWVALHGGVLRIDSDPGQGTRVRVTLPLQREAQPQGVGS